MFAIVAIVQQTDQTALLSTRTTGVAHSTTVVNTTRILTTTTIFIVAVFIVTVILVGGRVIFRCFLVFCVNSVIFVCLLVPGKTVEVRGGKSFATIDMVEFAFVGKGNTLVRAKMC
jgi:uncharacterized membrane protein